MLKIVFSEIIVSKAIQGDDHHSVHTFILFFISCSCCEGITQQEEEEECWGHVHHDGELEERGRTREQGEEQRPQTQRVIFSPLANTCQSLGCQRGF